MAQFRHETLLGVETVPADTSLDAARVQYEIFRRMPASRRLELAMDMSAALREVTAAGVRQRHPDYDERQVRLAVVRLTIGDILFQKAFPGAVVDV
jgi:hypothetical protein